MVEDSVKNTTSAERQAMEDQAAWDHYEAKMAELEERARKKGPKALEKFQNMPEEKKIQWYNAMGKTAKKLKSERNGWDYTKMVILGIPALALLWIVVGGFVGNLYNILISL